MPEPISPDPKNRREPPGGGAHDSPEEISRGAHGRYGIEEESGGNNPPESPTPKTRDEIARDAARDAEVRNTGEDLA